MLGLAQLDNTTVHPLVFALISFVLFLVGLILVFVFVRLRKIVIECLLASVLIKKYYKKYATNRNELTQALLWDRATVPSKERPTTASFLLVLMVIVLNSAMLGAVVFFALGGSNIEPSGSASQMIPVLLMVVVVFGLSSIVQSWLYITWVNREIRESMEAIRGKEFGTFLPPHRLRSGKDSMHFLTFNRRPEVK